MPTTEKIYLTDSVGELGVRGEDGDRLYDRLLSLLSKGKIVEVSFKNVRVLTTHFLNSAFGQLYGAFEQNALRTQLYFTDIDEYNVRLLKIVMENARLHFKCIKNPIT